MGCGNTRCRGIGCTTSAPACQLINGLCHACHAKSLEKTRPNKLDVKPKTK